MGRQAFTRASRAEARFRSRTLISIKKYLDDSARSVAIEEPDPDDSLGRIGDCYRALLLVVGKSALRACTATGCTLEQQLSRLEASLARHSGVNDVEDAQRQVEDRLNRWGQLTSEHLKSKADEVKELLMLLARTAESVGERDHRYSGQFDHLTAELKNIANLDDLTLVRSSLVRKATELKTYVDKMTQEGQQSLSQLRTKVSGYESKLKAAEQLASKDPLTGLANRRTAESRMEWYDSEGQMYSVVILDLDSFKGINDNFGHATGDDLLRKFAEELQKNMRSSDLVARWGGDEFIVVLACDINGARLQVERMRQWVMGRYTIQKGNGPETIKIDIRASAGAAQWEPGMTGKQVIEKADAAMYEDKNRSGARR
jgi:diguanylate cyclase (GGDEF)-like protein